MPPLLVVSVQTTGEIAWVRSGIDVGCPSQDAVEKPPLSNSFVLNLKAVLAFSKLKR